MTGSLEARIKSLEAKRTERKSRLARFIDPLLRQARVLSMEASALAGSTHPRHLRVAELLDLARRRAAFAELA